MLLRHLRGRASDGHGDLPTARDQPSDHLPPHQRAGAGPGYREGTLRSAASGAHQAGRVQGDRAGTPGGVSAVDRRAAAYPPGYTQLREYVRKVRPGPPAEAPVRFETDLGLQGQVDFAHFRFPWGHRYSLPVVLRHARLWWLGFFRRQDMSTLFRGLPAAFGFFGRVPCGQRLPSCLRLSDDHPSEHRGALRIFLNPRLSNYSFDKSHTTVTPCNLPELHINAHPTQLPGCHQQCDITQIADIELYSIFSSTIAGDGHPAPLTLHCVRRVLTEPPLQRCGSVASIKIAMLHRRVHAILYKSVAVRQYLRRGRQRRVYPVNKRRHISNNNRIRPEPLQDRQGFGYLFVKPFRCGHVHVHKEESAAICIHQILVPIIIP